MGLLGKLFGKKESPNSDLWEEIQTFLQSTLIPLGFEQIEVKDERFRGSEYSKGELFVSFKKDVLDSVYFGYAASKSKDSKDHRTPIPDFVVERHFSMTDKFKNNFQKKLNEWLVIHGVK